MIAVYKSIFYAIGCCSLLLHTGCMMPFRPQPPLPDMSVFEEGDVILTFSGAVEAWGIAFCSGLYSDSNPLPCSHAEAVYRDARQRLMLAGVSNGRVRTRPLKKALPEFQHLQVYRAQRPLPERRRAASVLEQWMNDPQIRSAAFDYTLQDVPGRRDAFCCVGFLNEVFREAGLEAPFIQTPWQPNAVARHLEELLDFNFDSLISVDSIQENPAYEKINTWHRLKRRGKLKGLDHEQQQQLVQTICEKYRDRYFYRMDLNAYADGMSKPSHTLVP